MPAKKYHLVHWLRDAYAMEIQSLAMMERQRALVTDDLPLEKRLEFHLEETRDQVEKIADCLEHLGSNTDGIKMGLSRLVGNMQAITLALGMQDPVKNMIIGIIFERFEIGCYEAIIVAAQEAGEFDIANACHHILAQERGMESWMEKHLPSLTRHYLEEHNEALFSRLGRTPGVADIMRF